MCLLYCDPIPISASHPQKLEKGKTIQKDKIPEAVRCSFMRVNQLYKRQAKMRSVICSNCPCFAWKASTHKHNLLLHPLAEMGFSRTTIAAHYDQAEDRASAGTEKKLSGLNRRSVLLSGVPVISTLSALALPGQAMAVVKQGLLAGRIPGLSEPDEQGWRTYRRPDEKSGGHGVGWSPIIPYQFSVPEGWEEVPVSIADLGGTEIDLRFTSPKQGTLFVIVAPVLRFAEDLGENATIEKIGPPERVIDAFGPEVIGENVEGKVLSMEVTEHAGRKYYQFELEPPHALITATAAGNRLYLFNVLANGLKWKRHYKDLKQIADSFRVI